MDRADEIARDAAMRLPVMIDPKLIEIVARAFRAYGFTSAATRRAELALAAINASGTHWVAPIERTEAMREAMLGQPHSASTAEIWTAMRTAYLAEPQDQSESDGRGQCSE